MATKRRGAPSMKAKLVRYFLHHPGHTRKQRRNKKGAPDFARVQTLFLMRNSDGSASSKPIKVREREMLPSLGQFVSSQKDYYADVLKRAQAARRESLGA